MAGQHHPAEDAVGTGPRHLLDGAVHVVEVDRHAAGPAPGCGGAEVGEPAHVARAARATPPRAPCRCGRPRYMAGDSPPARIGSGQRHLGVDALLLEDLEPAAVAVARHHPVGAVVGQPALRRRRCRRPCRPGAGPPWPAPGRTRRPRRGRIRRTWRWRARTCRRRRRPPRGAPGRRRRGSGRGCPGEAWVSAETTT